MRKGNVVEIKSSEQNFKPGGGYCFHNWQGKSGDHLNTRVPKPVDSKDEFSEWRQWMKDYLEKNSEEEKSRVSNAITSNEDLVWNTHVQHAREVQKSRAHEIASFVVNARQAKTAKMFQQRFEHSEKFALISEPGDKRPPQTQPPSPHVEKELKQEKKEEGPDELDDLLNPRSESGSPGGGPDCELLTPPRISADHGSALNILPSKDVLLFSPQPWIFKTDPFPPSPPSKNFNRSAKGFVGSYVSPYN